MHDALERIFRPGPARSADSIADVRGTLDALIVAMQRGRGRRGNRGRRAAHRAHRRPRRPRARRRALGRRDVFVADEPARLAVSRDLPARHGRRHAAEPRARRRVRPDGEVRQAGRPAAPRRRAQSVPRPVACGARPAADRVHRPQHPRQRRAAAGRADRRTARLSGAKRSAGAHASPGELARCTRAASSSSIRCSRSRRSTSSRARRSSPTSRSARNWRARWRSGGPRRRRTFFSRAACPPRTKPSPSLSTISCASGVIRRARCCATGWASRSSTLKANSATPSRSNSTSADAMRSPSACCRRCST